MVTRYHSLVIDEATLPQEYQVDARTEDQAVMAISHRTYPIYGVQFHPEAVLTQYGHELLENFHCICQQWRQGKNGGVLCIRSGKSENIRRSMFYFPDGKRKRTSFFFWILL